MAAVPSQPDRAKAHELALQRVLSAWILTGLAFLLLPGTFLGVWNLIAISGQRTAARLDPAWIQAHGHAQLFGWIGTFIIGIGFYSLGKMGLSAPFAARRAWTGWALWTGGVGLRWATNLWQWRWRAMLPASAALELAAFLVFFFTVRRHRPAGPSPEPGAARPVWMTLVMAGSIGFFAALGANLAASIYSAAYGASPAVAHALDQRLLVLYAWGFPVLTIWGFSARWLPTFLGLSAPSERLLPAALALAVAGIGAALFGWFLASTAILLAAAAISCAGLHVFLPPVKPPKILGVHATFPLAVRLAYAWLPASCAIALAAALWDRAGGLWGASRHALTVGFMAAMVFAIGQRVLPAFCGMRVLYSPRLMFAAAVLLNAGCLLRVTSEIGAYESYATALWPLLPLSAVLELTAVTLFAANLALTLRQPPAHLAAR
ncbi:MAG: NnrS family protein [Acidobacteriota bacterium]|nr:NnrS family protein [Acidobacteriota bacterium]